MQISRRDFGCSAAAALALLRPALLPAARLRPKLLLIIIVEQFRGDYLDSSARSLSKGGFRRLTEEGAWFPDCRCLAGTFTSSALATLATGAWPAIHGIVADTWYDPALDRAVTARPEALLATTLASRIASHPGARVFICSMEAVHGGLLEGQTRATGFFFMDQRGQFSCRDDQPAWLTEYNDLNPVERLHNAAWTAFAAGAGAPPLRTLEYDSSDPGAFLTLYRSSPFAQAAEFDVARQLIARERLGQGDTLDALIVSLGATAQLGYEVGARSPLMQQLVLHLDREIEYTIDFLGRTLGPERFAVAVSAAHGAPPAPEPERRADMAVSGEGVARFIDSALSERFDTPPARSAWIEKYVYPFLYLTPEALRRNPRETRAAAGRAAMTHPAVAGYYTADGDCSHRGEWRRRFRNSFHPQRSGDVMLSYRPGYVEEYDPRGGVSYGSLYNYEVSVPLFLYGPQFRTGVFETPVESVDVAPTLARVAGVEFPSSSTGRVLGEALTNAAGTTR